MYGTVQIRTRVATVVQPEKHCFFSSEKSLACWEPWRKYYSEGRLTMLSSIVLFLSIGSALWAFPLNISLANT